MNWFSANQAYIVGGIVVLIFVIVGALYFLGYLAPKPAPAATTSSLSTATSTSPKLPATQSGPEGFQMPTVPPQSISADQVTFVNLQPLSIKDTGFTGPYNNGSYDTVAATANALKSGFRFLTLQIDYMDSTRAGFEEAGDPTLIIRGPNNTLLSKNSGSINEVATTIANMAFRPEVPHNTRPVIVYLHITRSPNPVTNPNGYLNFLSKIAKALNPLAPMHLGLTPLGNFTRQKMADTLLNTPLQSLEGQVIILSNADTSLFRTTSSSVDRYNPAEDLDFWVNMRVYLDSEEDSIGITNLSEDNKASAVLVDLNRILALSKTAANSFAAKGRSRYVIAMPSRTTNPTAANVDKAINTLGVNVVPLDIFTDTTDNVKNIVSEYAFMPYHPKPTALRNIAL
jgi:hypothetical protein